MDKAEADYLESLAVAVRQQAKSYELRTTMSLGRIWVRRGQTPRAKAAPSSVYNWFTEGFGTPDLKEAKQLLEEWSLP